MSHGRVVCIVGPTASGKSDVADSVALRLGGEIVSTDSMQVYKGMDIGTAKVAEEERRVPLHMVDIVDVSEPYSVAQFQLSARACVDEIMSRQKAAVLCGGTGLYLDAVVDKLEFPADEVKERRRAAYEEMARTLGDRALYAMLEERDSLSASLIHPHNTRRVIRALELSDEGQSYAHRNEGLKRHDPYYEPLICALTMPREMLYKRIDNRVDAMFAAGLIDEVRMLDGMGLRSSHTASQAIGYKEVLGYLDDRYDVQECVALVKRNTRRYAKRQLSWIRRDGRARSFDVSQCSHQQVVDGICEAWEQFNGAL